MKQYLHTIMRSLCIMLMLCGMNNGAWAQSFDGGDGTESSPYVVTDWDTFVSYITNHLSSEEYFQLGTDLTIDGSSTTWTPISGFAGHFDGNGQNVTMKNCTYDACTLFADETDNSNITNMPTYKYSFSTEASLKELSSNASSWCGISTDIYIDLTAGDIEIDGDNWSPITESFNLYYDTDSDPHYVIFNFSSGYSAYDMSNSAINLLSSDTSVDSNCKYNFLTVSGTSDFEAWASSSDLVAATMELQLLDNLDYSSSLPSSGIPVDYTGIFDQNGFYIYYPAPSISDSPTLLFNPEYVQGEVVYTPNGALQINDATDFETFTSNQDYWYGVSGGNIDIYSSFTLYSFYTPVQKKFTVTNPNNITVGDGSNYLNMADYQPVFENEDDNGSVIYNLCIDSAVGFEKLTSTSFSSGSYIYLDSNCKEVDLTDITIGSCTSNSLTITEDVTFYLPDNRSDVPFSQNESGNITKYYSPSCYLIDALYQGALFDSSKRGSEHSEDYDYYFADLLNGDAGYGTESSPYKIYTYEMLKKLAEIVNKKNADFTSGMYIKLASDINAQGNERLTDENGNPSNTTATIQFSKAFKGHFDGQNHSIGGLTRPLFSSLDGAEIKNLGIVDCNMTTPALVAETASGSTVTMSYVSGVSNGLIPASGVTATNCYAWNTNTKTNTTYSLTAETKDDLSGTHKVLKANSYAIAGGYSDCTLFNPTSNTLYTYSPSSDLTMSNYISYINWADNFDWIESPCKSNVALLHNVLYNDFWNKNTCNTAFEGYGGKTELPHLYSWYIVDKVNFTVPSVSDPFRVKNIYYSRQNTTTGAAAPDGLNTIYLPFAWNPATDLYYGNGTQITDAEVYILADKLNSSDQFTDDANYKDYSTEKSLLFFKPNNSDFAKVSNALPTILNIPSGKSGWYIKRTELANYGIEITDNKTETINGETVTYPNLYDRYWEDPDAIDSSTYDESAQKKGRSFMEIGRLNDEEWSSSSDKDNYTYKYYHSIDEMSSCSDNPVQVTEMNRDEKDVYDSSNSLTVTIYKAPESNEIAVDGGNYQITIKSYDEDNNESILYETDSYDRIVLDSDGNPAILYASDENEKVVINNDGTINVYTPDGNGGYTSSGDPISVDVEKDSKYPITSGFYVCGGHEDGSWESQSEAHDFPGRAYHLGTFTGIAKNTFGAGTYGNYKCFKLNSAGTGFAKVTSSSTVQPFRTFFAIAKGVGDIDTGTPSTEAKAYRFGFCGIFDGADIDDTPTEIDGAPVEGIKLMTTAQSRVYSLDGRYVGQYGQKKLARGMYIMNGKKFVVK